MIPNNIISLKSKKHLTTVSEIWNWVVRQERNRYYAFTKAGWKEYTANIAAFYFLVFPPATQDLPSTSVSTQHSQLHHYCHSFFHGGHESHCFITPCFVFLIPFLYNCCGHSLSGHIEAPPDINPIAASPLQAAHILISWPNEAWALSSLPSRINGTLQLCSLF